MGASLLIIALGYWLIIQESFIQYHTLKEQESSLKLEFERKQRQLYPLIAYRIQLQTLKERFALALTQFPKKNEMPGLIEKISRAAVISGLKFELFALQPETIRDFYVELPIKISVRGTYFQLAMFISRIAGMTCIVTLHDFSIEKDHQGVSAGVLLMNITAKIYRYYTPS